MARKIPFNQGVFSRFFLLKDQPFPHQPVAGPGRKIHEQNKWRSLMFQKFWKISAFLNTSCIQGSKQQKVTYTIFADGFDRSSPKIAVNSSPT